MHDEEMFVVTDFSNDACARISILIVRYYITNILLFHIFQDYESNIKEFIESYSCC